jgi:hypothetical protein
MVAYRLREFSSRTTDQELSYPAGNYQERGVVIFYFAKKEGKIIRLPWQGQCDRAAAGCARAAAALRC